MGVENKMESKMEVITMSICTACPNNCVGCYAENTGNFMTFNDFQKIVKKLPKTVKQFIILGGEPFLNKELKLMLQYLVKKRKIKANILTSGVVKANLKHYKNLINNLFVTIKYPNLIDNEWKGNPNAFRLAKEMINDAKENEIKVVINWCVDKENKQYFEKMIELAKGFGIEMDILRFMPYSKDMRPLFMRKKEWNEFCAVASQYKIARIASASVKHSYNVCPAGIVNCNIFTNGNVTPCMYDVKDVVGNLKIENWNVISQKLREWRENLAGLKGCPVLYDLLKNV